MFANLFGNVLNPLDISCGAILIVTAIFAIIGTVLVEFYSNICLVR